METTMPAERVYLNTDYHERFEVKALGARWDVEKTRWYVPPGMDLGAFEKWMGTKERDGAAGVGGLYVDLVPSSCWQSNVRTMLSASDWDAIRREVYASAGQVCQICGGRGPTHPVEAHERWGFDVQTGTQTLLRVEALCPACHQATHFGLAQVHGRAREAFERLKFVNGWSDREASDHIDEAFEVWGQLSRIKDWRLDLSWLLDHRILSDESVAIINDLLSGKTARYA